MSQNMDISQIIENSSTKTIWVEVHIYLFMWPSILSKQGGKHSFSLFSSKKRNEIYHQFCKAIFAWNCVTLTVSYEKVVSVFQ